MDRQKQIDFHLQKIESLPSLPMVVIDLMRLIENPMTSMSQIEEVISRDQALTLKILRLANSAYYAIPGGAKTIKRAITFLGLNTLKQVAISASIVDAFKKIDSPKFRASEFWRHSFGTAVASETIANYLKVGSADEAFICGLIHDMGKLVLMLIDPEDFLKTCAVASEKGLTFYQAELERETVTHTMLGSLLAKKWKLPLLLQSVIMNHHSAYPKLRNISDPEINQLVDIIFIANQTLHQLNFGNSGYLIKPEYNKDVLSRLQLTVQEDEAWLIKTKTALSKADSMINELMQ